ncbi:nucleoside triphosphate pyrophosphohydrolase [Dehalococcoidia bacterium]|nr:nucleoside triphosphate pyrophosphohydrolase [Dehalococcoidia bacterium]
MEENLASFTTFRSLLTTLCAPDGCPWDRVQTHESLKPYLIEEAYETLRAIEEGDAGRLCDELGDLLLQIGLHSQIAQKAGEFDLADVLRHLNEKLIRRHPHVFGSSKAVDAQEVSLNWEELKRGEEGRNQGSLLDNMPANIPALACSQIIQQRAARVGFDWKEIEGVLDKVREEMEELKQAKTHEQKVHEFGDLIFALANAARWMNVDLEAAVRQTNERFCHRFAFVEELSRKRGISLHDLSLEDLDALWEEAKREPLAPRNIEGDKRDEICQ